MKIDVKDWTQLVREFPDLSRLVLEGYGLVDSLPGEEEVQEQLEAEYSGVDHVWLVVDPPSVLGSLAMIHQPVGNCTLPYFTGLVIDPQHRRRGLATNLLSRAVADLDLKLFAGHTNVPEALSVFLRFARNNGWRGIWGGACFPNYFLAQRLFRVARGLNQALIEEGWFSTSSDSGGLLVTAPTDLISVVNVSQWRGFSDDIIGQVWRLYLCQTKNLAGTAPLVMEKIP